MPGYYKGQKYFHETDFPIDFSTFVYFRVCWKLHLGTSVRRIAITLVLPESQMRKLVYAHFDSCSLTMMRGLAGVGVNCGVGTVGFSPLNNVQSNVYIAFQP